jgi:hypothetical protein
MKEEILEHQERRKNIRKNRNMDVGKLYHWQECKMVQYIQHYNKINFCSLWSTQSVAFFKAAQMD